MVLTQIRLQHDTKAHQINCNEYFLKNKVFMPTERSFIRKNRTYLFTDYPSFQEWLLPAYKLSKYLKDFCDLHHLGELSSFSIRVTPGSEMKELL